MSEPITYVRIDAHKVWRCWPRMPRLPSPGRYRTRLGRWSGRGSANRLLQRAAKPAKPDQKCARMPRLMGTHYRRSRRARGDHLVLRR